MKLATCLLVDGFASDYEVAVGISNDSDLEEPIAVANKAPGLLSTYSTRTSTQAGSC